MQPGYDEIQCGSCLQAVQVPRDIGIARCACGSYTRRMDVGLDAVRAFIAKCEGPRAIHGTIHHAVGNGPLPPFNPALRPSDVLWDSRNEFGPPSIQGKGRDEFYACWSAYDAAVDNMPLPQQDLQRKAEILELERLAAL